MFGSQHHEGGPPQGVGPGGKDLQGIARLGTEHDVSALRAADPVGLQRPHALRPIDAVEAQQLLRIPGDAEEPLLQVALGHRRVTALAQARLAQHLLARQSGVAVGAEVHRRTLAVGQVGGQQLEKVPLRPAVVGGIGGDRLALPVPHRPHAAELGAHARDVGVGPLLGVDVAGDGSVFRRQAEGVEADRVHHVVAVHAQVAGARVGRRHRVPMADVQVAGRIGQHGQEVVLLAPGVDARPVQPVPLPALLPLRLNGSGLVGHPPLADRGLSLHVLATLTYTCRSSDGYGSMISRLAPLAANNNAASNSRSTGNSWQIAGRLNRRHSIELHAIRLWCMPQRTRIPLLDTHMDVHIYVSECDCHVAPYTGSR